jgi:hypothetical protein
VKKFNLEKVITTFKSNDIAFEGMEMINFDDRNTKPDFIKMINHMLSQKHYEKKLQLLQ